MKLSILTLVVTLFAVSVVSAQRDDKRKTSSGADAGQSEGVIYALPQTGIRVYVKATREHFENGPFYMYSQKMLGIDNVPSTSSDRWSMNKMHLEVFNEPDPEQVHKATGQAAQLVSLTESGIIAGINTENKTQESKIETQSFLTKNPKEQVKFTDLSIWSFYSPADSAKRYKLISKNMEQKAAEAAETIFNLRNSRFALLTNANDEPLPDGKSFEIMTKELGEMEKNYVALFIGKSTKETYEFSFDFIPGSKTVKGEVYFRFSEDRGVLPKSDLSGRPIILEVIKAENLALQQSGLSNSLAGGSGLYYRLPGIAEIRILDGSTQLAGARTPIAQFGTTVPVPENLLQGAYKLEFHPNTGAIKSITEKK